mmetsp:Transcript_12003/g.34569  ORF Transcript_12003/g.34569 Transcript_12003/m.34569 type:complete len:231 (-) Transcript_12003:716-1408(-)
MIFNDESIRHNSKFSLLEVAQETGYKSRFSFSGCLHTGHGTTRSGPAAFARCAHVCVSGCWLNHCAMQSPQKRCEQLVSFGPQPATCTWQILQMNSAASLSSWSSCTLISSGSTGFSSPLPIPRPASVDWPPDRPSSSLPDKEPARSAAAAFFSRSSRFLSFFSSFLFFSFSLTFVDFSGVFPAPVGVPGPSASDLSFFGRLAAAAMAFSSNSVRSNWSYNVSSCMHSAS